MTPRRSRGSRRRRASSPSSTAWAFPIPRRRANGREGGRLARQAQRRRRRQPYRAEPAATRRALDLLPGARRWTRGLGAVRRQWTPRARAWLQRAMDGADPAKPVSLWRRAAASLSHAKRGAPDELGGCGDRPVLRGRRPRLGRLSGGGRRRAAARDQPASRRHARHFRQRRQTPHAAASRSDPRGAAAARRSEIR